MKAQDILTANEGKIVAFYRQWNNDRSTYEDSITVWNFDLGRPEKISLGDDAFDAVPAPTVNKESNAFKAFQWHKYKELRKVKSNIFRQQIGQFIHHGRFQAGRIVKLLENLRLDQREAIEQLMKVRKFRSEFRKNLSEQVLSWLKSKKDRKYTFPLSPKQVEACFPRISRFGR